MYAHNIENGVEYFTFRDLKLPPFSYAVVEVLEDNTLAIKGFNEHPSFGVKPYSEYYECGSTLPQAQSSLWSAMVNMHDIHRAATASHTLFWLFNETASSHAIITVNLETAATTYEDAEDWQASDEPGDDDDGGDDDEDGYVDPGLQV